MACEKIGNTMVIYDRHFSILTGQTWKIEIVFLTWNFVRRLIRTCWIWMWCSNLLFWTINTILEKFGPKRQNCLIKKKLGDYHHWQNILLKVRKSSKIGLFLRKFWPRLPKIDFWSGEWPPACIFTFIFLFLVLLRS